MLLENSQSVYSNNIGLVNSNIDDNDSKINLNSYNIDNTNTNLNIENSSNNNTNTTSLKKKETQKWICQIHSKDLEAFCENDKEMLCVSCIIDNGHKNHDLSSIDKAVQKEKAKFLDDFEKLEETEIYINSLLTDNEIVGNKMKESYETNLSNLNIFYDEIISAINDRKNVLKARLNKQYSSKEEIVKNFRSKLVTKITNISKLLEVKNTLDNLNEFQILANVKENLKLVKEVTSIPEKVNSDIINNLTHFTDIRKDDEIIRVKKIVSSFQKGGSNYNHSYYCNSMERDDEFNNFTHTLPHNISNPITSNRSSNRSSAIGSNLNLSGNCHSSNIITPKNTTVNIKF